MKLLKLNIGCGEHKLKGCVNIDREKKVKPDLILDVRKQKFPYEAESVKEIYWMHCIEHVETKYWPRIFTEFWRVLHRTGKLYLAYPEFSVCAKNLLEGNTTQPKAFWIATLYGRQLYPGDYHVTPIFTKDLIRFLFDYGFDNIKHKPEVEDPYNTFLIARKGIPSPSREEILKKEIFGK